MKQWQHLWQQNPEPPADVDREALEALIKEAEGYNRTDYTEESWAVFAEALTNAYSVDQNVEATQDDVDKAAESTAGQRSTDWKKFTQM